MIGILIDENVGLRRAEVLRHCPAPLVGTVFCEESGQWLMDNGESIESLRVFLHERIAPPPETNYFFLVWASPDDRLISTLDFFARQLNHKLQISLILTGPWDASSVDADVARLAKFISDAPGEKNLIQGVWLVGNESTKGKPVALEERMGAARAIVGVICAGEVKAAEAWALDPGRDSPRPWHFIGVHSLLPTPKDTRVLQRHFARDILTTSIKKSLAKPEAAVTQMSLEKKPRVDVEEILMFPLRGQFTSDTWPSLFSNIFEKWRPPVFRHACEQQLEGLLARDFTAFLQYVEGLRQQLREHSISLRKEAQKSIGDRMKTLNDWLRDHHELASLAMLLDHYFSRFPELDEQLAMREKSSCTSIWNPANDVLKRQFVSEPKDLFAKHKRSLLTWKDVGIWLLALIVAGGIALWMSNRDIDWKYVALLPAVVFLAITIRLWISFSASARLRQDLSKQRQSRVQELHAAFRRKIDRVAEIARRNTALQFISRNRRIGDRLLRQFSSFFGRWIAMDASPEDAGSAEALQRAGFAMTAVDAARQQILKIGTDLLDKSILGESRGMDLEAIFSRFANKIGDQSASAAASHQDADELDRLKVAWGKNDFPILARLNYVRLQSGLLRLAFLPQDESFDEFERELQSLKPPLSTRVVFARSPVQAPVVFQIKTDLDQGELREALDVTRINQ